MLTARRTKAFSFTKIIYPIFTLCICWQNSYAAVIQTVSSIHDIRPGEVTEIDGNQIVINWKADKKIDNESYVYILDKYLKKLLAKVKVINTIKKGRRSTYICDIVKFYFDRRHLTLGANAYSEQEFDLNPSIFQKYSRGQDYASRKKIRKNHTDNNSRYLYYPKSAHLKKTFYQLGMKSSSTYFNSFENLAEIHLGYKKNSSKLLSHTGALSLRYSNKSKIQSSYLLGYTLQIQVDFLLSSTFIKSSYVTVIKEMESAEFGPYKPKQTLHGNKIRLGVLTKPAANYQINFFITQSLNTDYSGNQSASRESYHDGGMTLKYVLPSAAFRKAAISIGYLQTFPNIASNSLKTYSKDIWSFQYSAWIL